MVVLAQRTGMRPGVLFRGETLLVEIMVWWALFAVGAWCVFRLPRRTALALVVVVTVAVRVAALTDKAPLSDDLYRYAWDGRVQAAGIDPYRYSPDADALRPLREESWVWSDPACPGEGLGPGERFVGECTLINRAPYRTIYPPVAQAWFLALHVVVPDGLQDLGYGLAGLAVDLALCWLLLVVLRRRGDDERRLALYAWAPVSAVETVQNAHVDGLAALLAVAGVVWLLRRPAVGSALVGAAVLVKLYPAVLLPLVLRRAPLLGPAVVAGLAVAVYAPHVAAVGLDVLGFLPGYLRQEEYDTGGRFLLLPFGTAGTLVGAALLAAAGLWALLRRGPRTSARVETEGLVLFGVLLLVTAPVQTWYGLPLAALAALRGRGEWLAVCAAGYPLYVMTLLQVPVAGAVGRVSYGVAALVVVGTALVRLTRRERVRRQAVSRATPTPATASRPGRPASRRARRA